MEPFTVVKSKAVPLDRVNVDTDQIVPKQFLKLISKTGYGKYLFYDWRFDAHGKPRQDFVLNESEYAGRWILLTRDNFGSGSSREHAAWALHDYGFRAIIAPSFADIFYNNCSKNGILAARLATREIDYLFENKDLDIVIDLRSQTISAGKLNTTFEIDEFRKTVLLEGLDSIGLTLKLEKQIGNFESKNTTLIPAAG
ncbi:MAG: 3-isopropylmalate dehydratase small subunit [Nitrososphaera sp.]